MAPFMKIAIFHTPPHLSTRWNIDIIFHM